MVFLNESRCLLLAAIVAIISATQLDASEDKFDREVAQYGRELASWMLQALRHRTEAIVPAVINPPLGITNGCGGLRKRNSELINSLLGVPKVLNEAGRRRR